MKIVADTGALNLRDLANSCAALLRRQLRRHSSLVLNPATNWLARGAATVRRLRLRHMTFVGVTGSCGKTTTTLLTGAILSANAACHVKAGGNTERAVRRTLLKIDPATRFCVHEVAAYAPGHMARSVKILRPQIGVVTMVGSDHYRRFRGPEGVAREKATLIEALPRTGTAILNTDDPHTRAMASRTRAKILMFGCAAEADIRAADISSAWPDRLRLTVIHGKQAEQISTRLVGEHWVPSVLAAICCGIACGVALKDCARVIEALEPGFGRYSVHGVPGGPAYILDYKASYWTIASSLEFVRTARAPRKTIVFGSISDHPGSSSKHYRRVAREALEVADRVVFVGPQSGHVEKLRTNDLRERLFSFLTVYQASTYLAETSLPQELIVIKSSMNADHLERIFLSQLDQVVCWRERCGRSMPCPECSAYRKPWPKPSAQDDQQSPWHREAHPSPLVSGGPS